MKPYADTNFFTRHYLELPESPWQRLWLRRPSVEGRAPCP